MSAPRPPLPALPDPVIYENGKRPCNEPLVVNGETVGYCERLVKPSYPSRWRKPRKAEHRGPHRIEWWHA